jgi:hypothetical protein
MTKKISNNSSSKNKFREGNEKRSVKNLNRPTIDPGKPPAMAPKKSSNNLNK